MKLSLVIAAAACFLAAGLNYPGERAVFCFAASGSPLELQYNGKIKKEDQ